MKDERKRNEKGKMVGGTWMHAWMLLAVLDFSPTRDVYLS